MRPLLVNFIDQHLSKVLKRTPLKIEPRNSKVHPKESKTHLQFLTRLSIFSGKKTVITPKQNLENHQANAKISVPLVYMGKIFESTIFNIINSIINPHKYLGSPTIFNLSRF